MEAQPQNTVNEVKLMEGIYFTDYRKTSAGTNSCQNVYLQGLAKNEIPKNPELIIALYKENDNKISKLIYSIVEIKKMDDYLEDQDFVSAIVEDYVAILKTLDFQIQALEELQKIDQYNPFLKNNSVKDLTEQLEKYKKESDEFDNEIKSKENKPTTGTNTQATATDNTGDQSGKMEEERDSVYI